MSEETRLSESTRETLKNLILTIIHQEADFSPKPELEKVVNEIEDLLNHTPTLLRTGLIMLIKSLEAAPLAQGFRHTFSHLDPKSQKEFLYKMEQSSNYIFRGIIAGLKTLIIVAYFSEPEAEKAVGYDRKCRLDVKPEKMELLPEDFLTH